MPEKRCFRCGEMKPSSEFYSHPSTSDDLLGKCKSCCRADARNNRQNNPQLHQERDRARRRTPNRLAQVRRSVERNRILHPDRVNARKTVQRLIKSGRIARTPCSVCGSTKAEAHHFDYAKPLEVVWLCKLHHEQAHHREVA